MSTPKKGPLLANIFAHRNIDDGAVVILGLGRFGRALAVELTNSGVEVLCVDSDPAVVQEYATEFDHIVQADATNPEVLRQLGVAEASRVVIAIGTKVEASVLAASAVIAMGVPDVWAKASKDSHATILQQIGVHHIVRPETDMGKRVAHLIRNHVEDYLEFTHGFAVAAATPPARLLGKTVGEVNSKRPGLEIIAVQRGDGNFRVARDTDTLESGDLIIIAGPTSRLDRETERS
ncbi:TrkA family potassium uptake protein [Trueperella pecoris]|uniref:Trk system potassium uptake protein TrkA n=1 Tax=Trueperella pecoris TaxID=2733571 RepID=A0A7M1QUS8_9ACTO|nr:TrkA family potassium uptake protein [Trueperella pecoris]QOR45616.1 TrkA family potassium uptake protein [Trueperella pecoris]